MHPGGWLAVSRVLISTQHDENGEIVATFYRDDDEQHDAHVLRWKSHVMTYYMRMHEHGERM